MSDMHIFKRGKYWHIYISRETRYSLGVTEEREAKRILARMKKEALEGKLFKLDSTRTPVDTFFYEYLESDIKKSPATIKSYKKSYERFSAFFKYGAINSVKEEHGEAYIKELSKAGLAPATINIDIRNIKAAMNWGVKRGHIKKNPFAYIQQLKTDYAPPKALTLGEIEIMRVYILNRPHKGRKNDVKPEVWLNLFDVLLYTGLRIGDAVSARWQDLRKYPGVFYVYESKTKKHRMISVTNKLQAVFDRMGNKDIGRMFPEISRKDHASRMIATFFKEAGYPHYKAHNLRDTFVSHLIMAGVDGLTVSRIVGHSDPSVTNKHYAHLYDTYIKDILNKLQY